MDLKVAIRALWFSILPASQHSVLRNSTNRSESKTELGRFLYQVLDLLFPVMVFVFFGAQGFIFDLVFQHPIYNTSDEMRSL